MKRTIIIFCLISILIIAFVNIVFAQQPEEKDYCLYLIERLKDDNIGVRTSAAQLLGDRKVEMAVEPLLKMVKTEKRYCARLVAAVALYKIGDKSVIPELKKCAASDKCKTVRHVLLAIIIEMQKEKFAHDINPQIINSQ